MRHELELPPLPAYPADPSELLEGPVAFLDSGDGSGKSYLALGAASSLRVEKAGNAFESLEHYLATEKDWAFGSLCYELKDELEELGSRNPERVPFPVLHFFRPKLLFILEKEGSRALYLPEEMDEETVRGIHNHLSKGAEAEKQARSPIEPEPRTKRQDYLERVRSLKEHIQRGDIYEANFCQEFFAEGEIDPYRSFVELQRIARAPMAAYYKLGDSHSICASPERYLRIEGRNVLAQPIKGTAPRGKDAKEDEELAEELRKDPKERAENIMIVDLLRNDLSRTAAKGSVELEELCAVHSFPTVHQMISSIRSKIAAGYSPVDVIRNSFPMGSMTGAPKLRAMELIESHEGMRRGLYSGSIGYVDPEGNWDLNVVIRSILYERSSKYISAMVGGAITARSEPEKEYEECLLKAEALKKALS